MASVTDLLRLAAGELGQHEEPPGSNVTKYGIDYGMSPAPWCAEFACSWLWRQVGLPIPSDAQSPKGWASVGFFLASARHAGWVTAEPAPGDFACFDWDHNGWPDHVGVIEGVHVDRLLSTVEGNVSGPDNVGDAVTRKVRNRDFVVAFVRPPYAGGSPDAGLSPAPVPPEPRAVAPYPRLSNGLVLDMGTHAGDHVAIYQRRMSQRGWPISIDGVFGAQTKQVTQKFQAEKRLQVDGIVGPITWKGAFELPVT